MKTPHVKLAEDERVTLARLTEVLNNFKMIDPGIPLAAVIAYLEVAQHEGASVTDLCRRTGLIQSTMSRYLLRIGSEKRTSGGGYGLVRHDKSPDDLKRAALRLTDKGALLARRIARVLQGELGGGRVS